MCSCGSFLGCFLVGGEGKGGKGKNGPKGAPTGPKPRSKASLEYSRRRAGKRQRADGQCYRWSKPEAINQAGQGAHPAKATPPKPPAPKRPRQADTEDQGKGRSRDVSQGAQAAKAEADDDTYATETEEEMSPRLDLLEGHRRGTLSGKCAQKKCL